MSKRVYFFGLAIAVVALAFSLADQLFWEPGVSASNVRRIRPGMRLAEVEAILGGRSITDLIYDDVNSARTQTMIARNRQRDGGPDLDRKELEELHVVVIDVESPLLKSRLWSAQGTASRVWSGERGVAMVEFDERGRVKSACFDPFPQTGLLGQFHSWLGW
jgi:hypothetical protein